MDWRGFCEDRSIAYKEGGAGTKADNIYIECPWCNNGKQHLGLALKPPFKWGCWKDESHRGRYPQWLIMRLLRCGKDEATRVAGLDVSDDTVSELLAKMREQDAGPLPSASVAQLPEYQISHDCFPLRAKGRKSRNFVEYLRKRGLPGECVERYSMRGCVRPHGRWTDRLVLPIITPGGTVVGVTGRHIGKSKLRYDTDPSGAPNALLYNAQNATGGAVLVLVEGPIDSVKLDYAAHVGRVHAHAVGMMGLALGPAKESMLVELARNYDRVVLLLDDSALHRAVRMQQTIGCPVSVGQLPAGAEDPGALDLRQARDLMLSFFRN